MAEVYRRLAAVCAIVSACAAAGAQELRRGGFVGVQVVSAPNAGAGVLVEALVDGGSAKAAGIQLNDVITHIGNHAVVGVADFVQVAEDLRGGDVANVRIRRGRDAVEIAVPIRPRPFEHAADVDVTYGAVSVDGSLRRTVVTAPKVSGPHPAILYVNGIGCYSQESLDLSSNDARLLYGLTRAGFVTMRVEKSGMGDSDGPSCTSPDADLRAEVRAYTAGLGVLAQLPTVDPNAVFIVGLSIGGVEAPLIAAQHAVRGLVVVNTVAKPLFEYLIDSRRRQLLLARTPYDEVDRRMAIDEQCNHRLLVDKQRPETILADHPQCADHIAYPAPFTFMQQWADVNVAAAWKAIDRPVLVLYGDADFVSTIADDAYLASVINAFHPGRATVKAVAGMDHGMNKAASAAESFARRGPGEFQPALLDALVGWLRANV